MERDRPALDSMTPERRPPLPTPPIRPPGRSRESASPVPREPLAVRMRLLVMQPPAGVRFAVQRGKSALLDPTAGPQDAISFDLALRVGPPLPDGRVNFLGEYAQGTPADRFVYLNSGTLAGQADSPWTRRAKLKLASLPAAIVEAALADPEAIIEARLPGTMKDGGPICASVPAQEVAWSLRRPHG